MKANHGCLRVVAGLLLLAGLNATTACVQADELFPREPEISNLRVVSVTPGNLPGPDQTYDIVLEFDYQDGDGDIGTEDRDPTFGDFELIDIRPNVTWPVLLPTCAFKDSVQAGETVLVCDLSGGGSLPDTMTVTYPNDSLTPGLRIASLVDSVQLQSLPNLSAPGRVPSIRGTITFTNNDIVKLPESGQALPPTSQTVRYQIRIRDRAGNWSNALLSPPITLN